MTFTITAILGILAIVIPVLWSRFNSLRVINLYVTSRTSLDQLIEMGPQVEVSVAGKTVDDLVRTDFLLINNGGKEITTEDVIEPVILSYEQGAELYFVQHLDEGVSATIELHEKKGQVVVQFPLLNPREFVRFAVYTSSSYELPSQISSRIKGIREIDMRERNTQTSNPLTAFGLSPIVVLVFLSFLSIYVIPYFVEIGIDQFEVYQQIKSDPDILNQMELIQLKAFVKKHSGFISGDDELFESIKAVTGDKNKAALIRQHLTKEYQTFWPLALFSLLFIYWFITGAILVSSRVKQGASAWAGSRGRKLL